jgi:hypothetical protein
MVATLEFVIASPFWRERIFPVAVARLELVVERLVKSVAMLPVAVASHQKRFMMLVSWRVLLP